MSSGQDYTNRLLENVRQTLAPQATGLADDLRDLQNYLSSSLLPRIEEKVSALREIEFPSLASIVTESLEAVIRQKNAEKAILARFSREIRARETQGEILALLLETAHLVAPRVVLLVVRDEQIAGWSSLGYSDEVAANLQACSFPRTNDDILQTALAADGATTVTEISAENPLRKSIGADLSGTLYLVPLKAIQRPVALIVAQDTNEQTCDLESLCTIIEITGLCIENIALKILRDIQSGAATAPPPSRAEAMRPTPQVEDTVTAETSGTLDTAEQQPLASTTQAPVAAEVELAAEPEQATVSAETEAIEEAEEAAPLPASEDIRPAVPSREPQPLSEEERLHGEAKRFARLLVSEIKLYNEQRVAEGRNNRDLYVRLKRDIDRSREMYEKRISPIVSRKIDYFHDEVIRILGENDPSTLGSDYPGPRVES